MNTKVTVGICARNCAQDIERIVDLICSQDFNHERIEVIFIDDGSDDKTLSLIFKHAPRLNMNYRVYHQKWKGLGFSRNVVLKNAKGDYIVWVDDGTIISKNYIRKHVKFMDQHHTVGIAKGIINAYNGSNLWAFLENAVHLSVSAEYKGKFTRKLPGTGGSVYRVLAANQVGGFDERIYGATEDMDIAYRMLKAGWRIYKTNLIFQITYNEKFVEVWNKNYWYGYGAHSTLHKHKELSDILYKSTPFAGLIEGLYISFPAYKLTSKKIAFLLPIYFSIKRVAFCLGFIKSHLDTYRLRNRSNA